MPEYYRVREDLKKSLPGPYYQVLVALSHIFDALKQNKKFKIKLEVDGVGALDDIVFESLDDQGRVESTLYLQLKHASNDTEELKEGDFCTASGHCEIAKYFDDWFLFINNMPNTRCIYYTNRDLDNKLKQSGNFFQDADGYRFSEQFFLQNNQFQEKIVELIIKESVICTPSLLTIQKGEKKGERNGPKIAKNPTYKAAEEYFKHGNQPWALKNQQLECIVYFLKNYYRLMVGKFHVNLLEKQVSEAVHTYFGGGDTVGIFNAIISETWQWFRALGFVQVWTDETVKERLTASFHRFNRLPQEIGRSNYELNHYFLKAQPVIDRITVLTQLHQYVAYYAVTVVQSNQGVGKSTLIANYLLHQSFFKPGEYLYFNSFSEVQVEHVKLAQLDFIKLIVIDNVYWDTQELRQAVSVLCQHGKKVIVISTVPIHSIASFIIPTLSQEEITAFLIKEKYFENTITIGQKNVSLQAIVNLGVGGLFSSMQYPAKLKAICALSRPLSSSLATPILDSEASYIARITDTFKPVPLSANQVYPLYALNTICHHPEFKGSKWISYETEADLISFKQEHPNDENHIWIDLDLIKFPSDASISANIEILLLDQVSHEKKELYAANKLTIFIYENEINTRSFQDYFLGALLKINQVIFFRKNTASNLAAHYFVLKKQDGKSYFEYSSNKITNLPHQDACISYPKGPIQVLLKQEQVCSNGVLIVAEAGAGKSTSLKVINDDYVESQSLVWGGYHCVVLIPLNKLTRSSHANLLEVALYFLNVTEDILREAVYIDLMENKILFLLDGWDELNNHERQAINHILELFALYKHIVITSRPTDRGNLFFNPPIIYELQRFTLQQISECLYSFFDNKEHRDIANNFAQQASLFLRRPQNNEALAVIGLPLQCYLLCQAWEPEYEAVCRGENIKLPWERVSALSRVELYQLFVISRMRKFLLNQYAMSRSNTLISVEEISSLGHRYFLALQEAAYQQVFLNNPLKLGEDWFSQHILRLNLIDGETFSHKTYAEYFAALYIINLLQRDPVAANKLIIEYRYRSHYLLVFEFAAGIASYGDPIIFQDKSNLELFWEALLQVPRDCIGVVDNVLVKACYAHSNESTLRKTFGEEFLLMNNVFEKTENHQNSSDSSPDISSIPITSNECIIFEAPKLTFWYTNNRSLIRSLPVDKYSFEEKLKAANWLIDIMNKAGQGFIIQEACAEKLGALGVATPIIMSQLIKLLTLQDDNAYSRVKENTVKALIALDIKINELSDDIFSKFFEIFLTIVISDNQINWLIRQNYSIEKINILFKLLKTSSSISDHKKIILSLTDFRNEKYMSFIEILNTQWIRGDLGNLSYWALYAFSRISNTNTETYLTMIMQLEYLSGFFILKESLDLVMQIFESDLKSACFKECFTDKVYDFSLMAIQETLKSHEKYEHRYSMLSFITMLIKLKLDQNRMNNLLLQFLSTSADRNFWDCDAVFPCFRHLAPYFNQVCADYLFYKIISSRNSLDLSQLLNINFMDELISIESKRIFILMCLKIYQSVFHRQKLPGSGNPVAYLKNAELSLVTDSLFNSLEEPGAVAFFKQYLKINNFALTVSSDGMQIYTPGGVEVRSISVEVKVLLEENSYSNLVACCLLTESTSKINSSREFDFSAYSSGSLQYKKQSGNYFENSNSNFFPSNESTRGCMPQSIGLLSKSIGDQVLR